MKLKKFFSIILMLLLGFVLVACNGTDTPDPGNGGTDPGNGDVDPGNGDGDTDPDPDPGNGNTEPPTEIVIMHGAPNEVDPRRDDFSGREKAARIALHEEVEKELNVKIKYEAYPADAPWGPQRSAKIIDWHTIGQPRADIYWITTIWLKEIVDSGAIVPLDQWYGQYGDPYDVVYESGKTVSNYKGQHWGANPEPFRGENGLFINLELLQEIGVTNPLTYWDEGTWTWDTFTSWVAEANNALGANQHVLGSVPSRYIQNMIPLNNGRIIDNVLGQVAFNNNRAHEVYNLFLELKDFFEPGGEYDSGSAAWKAGNVLVHPGSLWLVRASNRWGDADFIKNDNIGVVPFPLPKGASKDDYIQPLAGEAIYTVATNTANPAKEELAFEVWTRVQLWDSPEVLEDAYEDRLISIFGDMDYVNVMKEISGNVYLELNEQLGISAFGSTSWQVNVNSGIAEGSVRARMEEILPVYRTALEEYLAE